MDIDTTPLPTGRLGSSHPFFGNLKKVSNNAQFSEGLMRYHSAPSSVLAGLLDDDLFLASEDSELAQLLSDGGVGSFSSLLDSKRFQQEKGGYGGTRSANDPQYLGSYNPNSHECLSESLLSSISEHAVEETGDTYHLRQDSQHSATDSSTSPLPKFNLDLISKSSSPSNVLSRPMKEESSVGHLSHTEDKLGNHSFVPTTTTQVASISSFAEVQCMNKAHPAPSIRNSTALLRQSSSPAGLLSQVNPEDFNTPGNPTSEAMFDGRGSLSGRNHTISGWHEDHLAAYSQRKRGRAIGMQSSPEVGNAYLSTFTSPLSSPTGNIDCTEASPEDSVLCKVRAKRGCATHPRSIAERQRRIKISERMKKLQDLVPNLDKQANTAEMLDKVVEYVKLLQRQVQELTLNRPSCMGTCQQNAQPSG